MSCWVCHSDYHNMMIAKQALKNQVSDCVSGGLSVFNVA